MEAYEGDEMEFQSILAMEPGIRLSGGLHDATTAENFAGCIMGILHHFVDDEETRAEIIEWHRLTLQWWREDVCLSRIDIEAADKTVRCIINDLASKDTGGHELFLAGELLDALDFGRMNAKRFWVEKAMGEAAFEW